ncbi:uncharacterized protein LOC124116692 [Haliotis rufescens]|uniref:uncharacterized protein LOC124116692 n=1 Tax=Haliotis rufescens TaxID=6454 RepID=UPI001EB02963|nr:uncharacterized protein LOC124116692 [Haliotis rufescens]XP_046334088.1 uncharacterized protein LOC124116692 [Haliotis rufescens]
MTSTALVYMLVARDVALMSLPGPFRASSKLHCGQLCSSLSPTCFSFYYRDSDGLCSLVDGLVRPDISQTVHSTGYKYYSRADPCISSFTFVDVYNICIKVIVQKMTFEASRSICQQYGADLAMPKDEYALSFLTTVVQGLGSNIYLGGEEVAGVWRWLDGAIIPDIAKHLVDQTCLEITKGGAMDPSPCSKTKSFICEIAMPKIAGDFQL